MQIPSSRKTSEPAKQGVMVSFVTESGTADGVGIQKTGERTSGRFLKLSEVQEMMGVSRSTVWRWTTENGLKVVRIGDVVRIRESDLQAFLNRHETSGADKDLAQPQSAEGQSS